MPSLRKIPLLVLVCLVAIFVDQASKFWAVGELTRAFEIEGAESLGERLRAFRVMKYLEPLRRAPVTVVEGFWRFRYLENPGAAWGMLGSVDPSLRLPFFRSAPLIATAILALLYFRAGRRQWLLRVSLALIIGGALGNFVDRWMHGYVIDFIDWHFRGRHWPTFNVADVFISLGLVGVGGEGLRSTFHRRKEQRIEEAAETRLDVGNSELGAGAPLEDDSESAAGAPLEDDSESATEAPRVDGNDPPPALVSEESAIASVQEEGGESTSPADPESPERARSD